MGSNFALQGSMNSLRKSQLILGWNSSATIVCSAAEEYGEREPRQSDRSWNEACVLPLSQY
jgi:hypothetical protein